MNSGIVGRLRTALWYPAILTGTPALLKAELADPFPCILTPTTVRLTLTDSQPRWIMLIVTHVSLFPRKSQIAGLLQPDLVCDCAK